MEKISAILITLNEEKNLEACLESLRWVDEIVIVDCGSRDATKEIALKYTDRFFHRAWDGYARQKAHALSLASNDWILSIDADERVTKELAAEIRRTVEAGERDGYFIPRDNYFLGRRMTGGAWRRDRQMRLFRRSKVSIAERPVHEGFEAAGETGELASPLLHFTNDSLADAIRKMNAYTSLEAGELAPSRKSSGGAVVLRPLSAFLRNYVSRKGYRDGAHGLLLAMIASLTTMLLYMKIWEIRRGRDNS